ncbi:hypothetical protein SLS57_010743 [Botryosphaeria dothidea]
MTTSASGKALRFYPERYYSASPTYNTWVKLTAAGVHTLRAAPSNADSFDPIHPTFFLLNHPIRFIRLVGTVVAVEDLAPRFALLTLDDGSGATIELKITRLAPNALDKTETHPSNTTIANVVVQSAIGTFEILVDGVRIEIGTTLKAKCTLSVFRGTMQGVLQRCWVLRAGTKDEMDGWRETAAFMRGVLARPWALSEDELRRLEKRIAKEEKHRRGEERRTERKRTEKAKRKQEFYKDRAEKLKAYEEKLDLRRRKEEVLMNKGALV